VIDRRRTQRRHRAAALGAAACALLVAVLVPTVGQHWLTGRAPASPAGSPTVATPTATAATTSGPLQRWPDLPRGSLAGDSAFLQAAQNLGWPNGRPSPPVASRTVVFAGDEGGVRWVLVAGPVDGQLTGQWFAGPAGAAPDTLAGETQEDLQGGLPLGHTHLDATGASLLVLTAPGNDVQVSPGVLVDADGKVHRDYASVPVHDGVAVVHETGAYAGSAVRFRVLHGGVLAGHGPSDTAVTIPRDLADAARQTPRRPSTGSAPATAVANALQQVLAETGLSPADVHPVLLWTGPIPLQGGASAQAVVLALTMPSGAVVTTTGFDSSAAKPASGTCGSAVHPAGTSLDSLVVVASCDTTMLTGGEATFVVSAPSAASGISLRGGDGSTISEHALVDGGGAVSDPGSVASVSITGPSAPAVQVTPTDQTHDPFAVD
jgi:hypothetical protein